MIEAEEQADPVETQTSGAPSITACAQCGRDIRSDAIVRFSPRGGAVCNACVQHGELVSKTALEGMRRMLVMEDADMDRVKLSDAVRGEIFRALSAYTENSVEFGARALDMLKSLQTPSQHDQEASIKTNSEE